MIQPFHDTIPSFYGVMLSKVMEERGDTSVDMNHDNCP